MCTNCGSSKTGTLVPPKRNKNIILQVIKHAPQIVEGTVNYLFNEDTPEIISRLDICAKCTNKYETGSIGKQIIYRCKECKCYIHILTRATDGTCDLNKW